MKALAATNDIRAKLASSEAAESLRMENFVATCFHEHKWPAEQGVYYSDTETGKNREIDVISRHVLQRPKQQAGTGAPLINISLICECKSLAGQNLIFQKGNADELLDDQLSYLWSGHEQHIGELVDVLAQDPQYLKSNKQLLYAYFLDRAYPDGRAIAFDLRLRPPPVELIAAAFRETKGGESRESDSQGNASPVWNAIRSVLSATRAAEDRFTRTMRSYTSGRNPHAYDLRGLVQRDAFFFDAELLRMGCFHPIVFCKSRLFCLEGDKVRDVHSARLYIRNLDFMSRYVDIVNFDAAKSYIGQMVSHFESSSLKATRKTWAILESLEWSPGQATSQLMKAVEAMPKPRRNKHT